MTKITPIFDKNGKKIPFFRARSARGGGRHAARQIDPPKFTAKTPAKTQPPNSPHTDFWNSTSHHTLSTFGIPLFIDRLHFWNSTICRSSPLLEFHYLQIASTFGIPLFTDRLHFWNSTSHHTPSTFGIPLFVYRPQLWNSNYRPYYNHCNLKLLSLTLQNPPYFNFNF